MNDERTYEALDFALANQTLIISIIQSLDLPTRKRLFKKMETSKPVQQSSYQLQIHENKAFELVQKILSACKQNLPPNQNYRAIKISTASTNV